MAGNWIPRGSFRGPIGKTPKLTATVTDGAPGSSATVEQAGTDEAPVFKLTIPKGRDGSNVLPTAEAIRQEITTPGSPANAALTATIGKQTFTVNLEDFKPDVDFAKALSDAIDVANTSGSEATVLGQTGKTYLSRGGITKTDVHCRINMNGARIVRAVDATNAPVLTVNYSITDVQSVTALTVQNYTFPGTTTSTKVSRIEVADPSAWKAGDVCKVFSDDLISWSIPANKERLADAFEVLAVEGNYIYAPIMLRVPFATNIRIGKMTNKTFELTDFWVEDAPGSPVTRNQPAVIVRAPVAPNLIRPRAENLLAEGFQLNSPYHSHIESPAGKNIRTSIAQNSWGYAIRENGPVNSKVIGGSAANLRHLYTSGAFDIADVSTAEPYRYGGAVNAMQQIGTADSVGHSAFDLHDDATDCAIIDCNVRFNHREPEGSQMGLKLRGRRHVVKGLTSHGPGGIVEESQTNAGGHLIVGHTHTGIPGYGGTAHQIRNIDAAGRIKGVYSGTVVWDDYSGELFRYTKADEQIPSLHVTARGNGTDVFRLFSLTDSRVVIDNLTIDFRGTTGTGTTEPRLFYLGDSLSELIVGRLTVQAGGVAYRLGDLGTLNGTVRIGELITDTLPTTFQGGFTNAGATATYYTNSVRLNGADLARGVDERTNGNATLHPFWQGTQRLNVPITADRTVTEATAGVAPGHTITYLRTAAATGAFAWIIGNASLTTPGTWLTRKLIAGTWATVASGTA